MKKLLLLFLSCSLFHCDKAEVVPVETYMCALSVPVDPSAHPQASAYEAILEELLPLTTGVQIAITDRNGARWTGATGFADIGNNVPLEDCHRLMIASISKVVTATMIMQLQDEGILDVDDPLRDWLPASLIGEIANADQVSLRQLLNHTSGIRDYLDTEQTINALNQPYLLETQREKLRYVYGLDAYHAPGAEFTYSNTNYVLLGLIIEQARGQALWDAVDQYIAQPLQLTRFGMGTEQDPIPADVARPYIAFTGGDYVNFIETAVSDAATGDGGIASNMQDLNLFIESLFSGQLLSAQSLGMMVENFVPVEEDEADFSDWPDEGYSLGVTRYNTPRGVAWGHTGNTSAYNSSVFYFPEAGATVSIVSNGIDLERIDEIIDKFEQIRDRLFDLALD